MRIRFRIIAVPSLLVAPLLLLGACGGSRVLWTDHSNDGADAATDPDAGLGGPIVVSIDPTVKQQILEGFGASVAWYAEWFAQHPNRDALARILFHDLGLDILRLRNQHRTAGDMPDPAGLSLYHAAEASLGHAPRVLLTSWSPPAALKASGKTNCDQGDVAATCTLRVDADGTFPYAAFADYWAESIDAYRAQGLDPYYVSIQNEPDFIPTGWEGCRFNETERGQYPGYDRALDATAQRFAESGITARILGPETAQLQSGSTLRYAAALNADQLYGIAHHLYDGTTWKNPNGYSSSMSSLATEFPNLPKFQTEFSPTESGAAVQGGLEVAWLIHNSIAIERASAYLHWELFWPSSGLVQISGADKTKWTNPDGYEMLQPYYSLRHFARYTDPGDAVVLSKSSATDVVATAYLSPDETRLTVVILNLSTDARDFSLDLSGFELASSLVFTTTETAPWQPGAPLTTDPVQPLQLPPRAILTAVASKLATVPE